MIYAWVAVSLGLELFLFFLGKIRKKKGSRRAH
jgi:hypothetical protein